MIYLDYAADTPAEEAVLQTFCETERTFPANPNSPHPLGLAAKARLDEAAAGMAALLGVREDEIIYTSGATESNNLAIKGAAQHYAKFGRHIVSTMLEHSSVDGPLQALQAQGFEVEYAPPGKDGSVDQNALRGLLREDTILVCVCAADSELGVRQDTAAAAELAHALPHCLLHVDATQAVGKLPVEKDLRAADLLTFAPHKFGGLGGSGVLLKKHGVLLEPQISGGLSTTPFRSGTPPLALIAAAQQALSLALDARGEREKAAAALNRRLRAALPRPGVVLNSPETASPYILNISLLSAKAEAVREELGKRGVCVATKSACCAPGTVSRPVYALTRDRKRALSTLRISLWHQTTPEEIEEFLAQFDACLKAAAR